MADRVGAVAVPTAPLVFTRSGVPGGVPFSSVFQSSVQFSLKTRPFHRLPMARSRTSEARGRTLRLRIGTFFAKWCAFSGARWCCIRSHSALGLHRKWGSRRRPIQFSSFSLSVFQFSLKTWHFHRLPVARSGTSEARRRTLRLHIDTFFAKWCAFGGSRWCCIRSHSALGLHQKWGSRGRPIQSIQFSSVFQFSSV